MRILYGVAVALLIFDASRLAGADETRTSLIIEGGGMPPYCPALEKLVEVAKVNGRIRIGYLPTASSNPNLSVARFTARLGRYGVLPEHIQTINVTVENAAVQAESPAVVAQVRDCTAVFFGGGDQTRITQALLKPDGTATAVLQAINEVWQGGGVIAGTSAGAAVQSETMISVSGFPDDSIDDGMDALDFGLTKSTEQPARRGLLVSRGLGFIRSGIIDQHFSQYRGRLGRLARAAIETKTRFGFGIDEDAAIAVSFDGTLEILGPGHVTIVDTLGAKCVDGSLGCSISGVHLTCLGQGDRFDPQTGQASIHPAKIRIEAGKERFNGNFQIPDIAGWGAVPHALIQGLGNNTSRKQMGVTLKHHRHYGHGYRFVFSKTEQSRGYTGIVNGLWEQAVTHVHLDIEPITLTLRPPATGLPQDLPQGPSRTALEAITFRGIMLADDQGRFRPNAPIARGELASAIAHVIHLEPSRENHPLIRDVPPSAPEADGIALVVAAGLMNADGDNFRPTDFISRQDAATVLVRLAERYRSVVLTAEPSKSKVDHAISPQHRVAVFVAHREKLLTMEGDNIRTSAHLTRAEAAMALYKIIGFSWSE